MQRNVRWSDPHPPPPHSTPKQPGSDKTIEAHLFRALRSAALIPETATYDSVDYTRCGRTDKGVSAFRQVVSLRVRSRVRVGEELPGEESEIDYAGA